MIHKRMLCLLLSLLFVIGAVCLTACSTTNKVEPDTKEESGTGSDDKTTGDNNPVYNIGYSNLFLTEDFFITVEAGIAHAAVEEGFEYNTTVSDNDATKMKQNIEVLVTKGADIIIDFNVMPEVGSAVANDLKNEGIPMISIDCQYEGAYFFGVNNLDAGKILGEAATTFVDEKFGGEIEYIVNVYNASSGEEVKDRNNGVVEVLQDKYGVFDDKVIWLDCEGDDVKSQTKTRDWLNSNPEVTKVVFVGQNDDRGYAINSAVEAEDRVENSLIVSHNADPSSIENLQKHAEDKDTAWVATTSFNAHLYGNQVIDMATRILNGEDVEQSEFTEVTIITADNVNDYVEERTSIMEELGL